MVEQVKNEMKIQGKIEIKKKQNKKGFFSSTFWKTENKGIKTQNIKNYKEAIKAIKFFIATYEWEKAERSIREVYLKEENSYKDLLSKLSENNEDKSILKQKEKLNKLYKDKQTQIEKLSEIYKKQKEKYQNKIEKQRFEIRFKNIKQESHHLAKTWKASDAVKLLWSFLEEYSWNKLVIDFYNKEKKFILKQIEKEKESEEQKLKQNAKIEAMKLIGETVSNDLVEKEKEKKVKKGIFYKLKESLNFYKKIKKNLEKKKLLDEINLLIEEEDKVKNQIASAKLENIHKGLIKDISKKDIVWYDLYGKILGAHKISGDTFWYSELAKKYTFFIWDATWHWIKAWFIITLLTRLFNKFVEKYEIKKLIYEINNGLKQDLKSMNFITWIFFEIVKEDINKLRFVGLWHEPILLYRKEKKEVEKIIPWWLAAWIRLIKDSDNIKVSTIDMWEDDILLTYSDGIVESKSIDWEFYSIDRLSQTFKKAADFEKDIRKIYDFIIKDAKNFRWWSNFDDDLTLMLLKRDFEKDKIKDKEDFLRQIWEINSIPKRDIRRIKWNTKQEIQEELEKLKAENYLKSIIRQLEQLWLTGEVLKLKSEAKRYIKQWYIHKKINYYLKKAIENEQKYKISLKEDRIRSKYNLMKELMKKGDYETVIQESENIISKDWNI